MKLSLIQYENSIFIIEGITSKIQFEISGGNHFKNN